MACPHQYLNHFQKSGILTRKDKLVRLLRRHVQVHGRIYAFVPQSYILPSEYSKFVREYSEEELERDDDSPRSMWICKPSDLSQGRKIFLINNIMDLVHDRQYVVQRYVDKPLTVGGYKVDLRVYVLVTSFNPLVVHVHRSGLARFATAKYDRENLGNAFSHLTNNSINKHSDTYTTKKDVIGSGCKWDFCQLKGWCIANGFNWELAWRKIERLIVLTLVSAVPSIPPHPGCFELFGFDVLLDEALKPWLLEVNCAPSLSIDCDVDEKVKPRVVREMFSIVLDSDRGTKPESEWGFRKAFPFNAATEEAAAKLAALHKRGGGGVSKPMATLVKKIVDEVKRGFISAGKLRSK